MGSGRRFGRDSCRARVDGDALERQDGRGGGRGVSHAGRENAGMMAARAMNTGALIGALLRSQGLAVFTHLGGGRFRAIGNFPDWLEEVGGAQAAPDGTLRLGERFPFVENFLT